MTFELDDLAGGLITLEPMAGGRGAGADPGIDDSTLAGAFARLASGRGAAEDGANSPLLIRRSPPRLSRLLNFAAHNGRAWLKPSCVSADLAGLAAELNRALATVRRRIENSR